MSPPWSDVATVGLAFMAGVLSGAFSMGGQIVAKPGIRLLGASPLEAVGTTVPMIFTIVGGATVRYARTGHVDWASVWWSAPFGAVAAIGGSLAAPRIPGGGHLLQVATAGLMLFTGARMFAQARRPTAVPAAPATDLPALAPAVPPEALPAAPDDPPPPAAPRRGVLAAVGSVGGVLAGLLGVGGGVLLVPGFHQFAGMSLRTAIATSLVCGGVFAIPATVTHAALGTIDWRLAVLLAVGSAPGARVGASLSIRASDRRLRLAVASMISAIAVTYAAGELAAVVGGL